MVAMNLETLISNICQEKPPPGAIRWGNSMVQDAFMGSIDLLCDQPQNSISVGVFELEAQGENMLEARIGADGTVVMTLQIQYISPNAIVVQGWSSE